MDSKYDILWERNHQDYDLVDLKTEFRYRLLANVSNDSAIDFGECRQMAVTDSATSNRRISEATKPGKPTYFHRLFQDTYSAQHLVDIEKDRVGFGDHLNAAQLTALVVHEGLADTSKYSSLPTTVERDQNGDPSFTTTRNVAGCPVHSANSFKIFKGSDLDIVDAAGDFTLNNPGSLTNYLHRGTAVGVMPWYTNSERMAEVNLYEPSPDAQRAEPKQCHDVMITGYGLAQRKSDKTLIPFYCFQNNWGYRHLGTGRMPRYMFEYAVAPCFDGPQYDLFNFMKTVGPSLGIGLEPISPQM